MQWLFDTLCPYFQFLSFLGIPLPLLQEAPPSVPEKEPVQVLPGPLIRDTVMACLCVQCVRLLVFEPRCAGLKPYLSAIDVSFYSILQTEEWKKLKTHLNQDSSLCLSSNCWGCCRKSWALGLSVHFLFISGFFFFFGQT
jgi:hypothetical protein